MTKHMPYAGAGTCNVATIVITLSKQTAIFSFYLPLNKLIRGYLFAEYKTYMTCPTLEKLASLITF